MLNPGVTGALPLESSLTKPWKAIVVPAAANTVVRKTDNVLKLIVGLEDSDVEVGWIKKSKRG